MEERWLPVGEAAVQLGGKPDAIPGNAKAESFRSKAAANFTSSTRCSSTRGTVPRIRGLFIAGRIKDL